MLERFYKTLSLRPRLRTSSRGVSLVEVVLAIALFSVIIGVVLGGQWSVADQVLQNARNVVAVEDGNTTLVSILGKETFEDGFAYQPVSSPGLFGISRTTFVFPFSRCEKMIHHAAHWRTGWGTFATTSLSFISTDLARAAAFAKDCGGLPYEFSDSTFREIANSDIDSTVAAIDSFKKFSLIALRPMFGMSTSTPDIAAMNHENPSEIQTLNIPMGETNGVNKVDAIDGFVFTANNSSTTQFAILRADTGSHSSDLHLQLIATSPLPGVAGVRPEAVSIFYFDSKIYIGTKRTAGHEFHVFDVIDPANPRWLGSREMNHNINDIVVVDGYAFLATSGNVRDLIVLDVRDPARITEAVTVDLPGTEDGRSVQVSAGYIFLGRYKATQPGRDELCVLKYWRDLGSDQLQISVVDSVSTGADVVGISVASGKIFAATTHPQKELQVFGFGPDEKILPLFTRNTAVAATGIDVENDIVSMSSGNSLLLFGQE